MNRSEGSRVCSTITSGAYNSLSRNHELDPEQSSSRYHTSPYAKNTEKIRHREDNLSNEFTASGLVSENVRPSSIEEDEALNAILSEIQEGTTDNRNGSERETPLIVNTTRNSASVSGGSNRTAVSNASQMRSRSLQAQTSSVNGLNTIGNPTRGNRESTTHGRIPTITGIRDDDRARSSRNNPQARVRHSNLVGANVDDDDERRLQPHRDRSNLRNVSSHKNCKLYFSMLQEVKCLYLNFHSSLKISNSRAR